MAHAQAASSVQVPTHRAARPWGVALVALFQAIKAVVLVGAVLLLHFSPEAVLGTQSIFYPILYIALRGNSSVIKTATSGGGALFAVILVFGLYLGYLATGLWKLRPSARRAVMLTSGMTLFFYLKSVVSSKYGDGSLSGMNFFSPDLHNVHLLLFIDTAIFVYLMRGSTASQFRQHSRRSRTRDHSEHGNYLPV